MDYPDEIDAWLHTELAVSCNFDCAHCFHHSSRKELNRIKPKKIDISAFIKTLHKTNKTFMVGFTGIGEPFLIPNLIEAVKKITLKHYVIINTNLTSLKIKDFAQKINPKKVLWIRASLHIKELERHNLTDRFVDNFLFCKRNGFNIHAGAVAYPPLAREVKKYKYFFKKKGIRLDFDPFIGIYNDKHYPDSYTRKELSIFGFTDSGMKYYHTKGRICNAGYNAGVVDPNGDIRTCSHIHENIGNIYKKINFKKKLLKCPMDFCECPLSVYNKSLFEKALREEKNVRTISMFVVNGGLKGLLDRGYGRLRRSK